MSGVVEAGVVVAIAVASGVAVTVGVADPALVVGAAVAVVAGVTVGVAVPVFVVVQPLIAIVIANSTRMVVIRIGFRYKEMPPK